MSLIPTLALGMLGFVAVVVVAESLLQRRRRQRSSVPYAFQDVTYVMNCRRCGLNVQVGRLDVVAARKPLCHACAGRN